MNGIGSSQLLSLVQEGITSSSAGGMVRADVVTPGATLQLSSSSESASTKLSATAGALASTLSGSDVRMGLVMALRESIGAGTYNVPLSHVAGKMLSMFWN